jgi:hypothetical protein
METDPVFKQKYEFNSVLIDFRKIPEEIQNTIWNSFLEICPGFANITKPKDPEVQQQPEPYPENQEKKEKKEIKIVPKRVALKIIPIARKSTPVVLPSSTFSE